MICSIDHFVITTGQPDNIANFYSALGFRVEKNENRYELFSGDFKINVQFLGKELYPHAGIVQPGSADLCFLAGESLPQLRRKFICAGITPETDILVRHGARGKMHSFYVRDPDGNILEFCSYHYHPECLCQ